MFDPATNQLTAVWGVVVNGTEYDIEFTEGSCATVFDGCDNVTDFTFSDGADADTAFIALNNQLNFMTVDNSPGVKGCPNIFSFCQLVIPTGTNSGEVDAAALLIFLDGSGGYYAGGLRRFAAGVNRDFGDVGPWLVFSPTDSRVSAVPNPATLPLFLISLVVLGKRVRQRPL